MDKSDPKRISLKLSLLLSISFLVLMLVTIQFATTKNIIFTVLSATTIFFVTCYLILQYYIKYYIYNKIRLIFKTIHTFKESSSKIIKPNKQNTSIKTVHQEVLDWKDKTQKELEDLKQHAKYRREFIGNISHELKTPIFNIQGYVLTLLDGAMNDPQYNTLYLQRTEASINRLISIIEDLEDITNLEAGELKLNVEKINIVNLAKEVVEQFEMKAKKHNVHIFFRKNYDNPINVICDKNKIHQVFNNLIDNSIKYGKENGMTKISFFDMHDHILCEITDDGLGIAKENLPRIFERFYRTDKARSRQKGGSGLGLAIVKHIIDAHNQNINVRSKIGTGTTFAFTLLKNHN